MNNIERFLKEVADNITLLGNDANLKNLSQVWMKESDRYKYDYNFTWMGRPVIQYPQDILAIQEIIWSTKPNLIIETGVAHGGSIIFYASMLELLGGKGEVIGIDIDIRMHNRQEIEKHSMFKRIKLIEGSSIDDRIVERVYDLAKGKNKIMVCLDSNHTHKHVLKELEVYSPLVKKGCYLVVFDTVIEDMPHNHYKNRPWNKGNNPKTAVQDFLNKCNRFEIDTTISKKLLISACPDGFLKCIG